MNNELNNELNNFNFDFEKPSICNNLRINRLNNSIKSKKKKIDSLTTKINSQNKYYTRHTNQFRKRINRLQLVNNSILEKNNQYEYIIQEWKIAFLKMTKILIEIKKLNTNDTVHNLCDLQEYIDIPTELTRTEKISAGLIYSDEEIFYYEEDFLSDNEDLIEDNDTLGDALPDTLGDALPDTLGDALPDTLGDALPDTLGDALPDTELNNINDTTNTI